MIVRPAQGEEHDAIAELNQRAFGGDFETALIDRLYDERRVELAMVAIIGGQVIGHILFSDLGAEIDGRKLRALALAPMSVLPMRQRQGIGEKLIEESLAKLRHGRYEAIFVLGHPDYYPRFGFSAELAKKMESPFEGEAFMALELKPGALSGENGRVEYPDAFFANEASDS